MSANCPGFRPHASRATRCRYCFKDYGDHKPEQLLSTDVTTSIYGSRGNLNKVGLSTSGSGGGTTNRDRNESTEIRAEATITLPRRRRFDDIDPLPPLPKPKPREEPVIRDLGSSLRSSSGSTYGSTSSLTDHALRLRRRPLSSSGSFEEASTKTTLDRLSSGIGTEPRRRRPSSMYSDASDNEDYVSSTPVRRRTNRSDGYESDTAVTSRSRVQIIAAKEVIKPRKQPDLGDAVQETNSPDVEFILRVKKSTTTMRENDADSNAPTETTEATETTLTCPDNMVEDLQNSITALKTELETSKTKCSKLEKEKTKLEKEKTDIINKRKISTKDKEALEKTASELLKLRTKVNDLETVKIDLADENKVLKLELKEMQKDLNKREAPEKVTKSMDGLKTKLTRAETLAETLMEENEEMKKEMKEMEEELDELHDNFREDQANEYLDLKKELENTGKNCRVLQFKLRKAERKCEQLEVEKMELDVKVKDLQATGKIDADKTKMKELEMEVTVAKEVSLKMHSELETMKEVIHRSENENEKLRKQLLAVPAGERSSSMAASASELPSLTKETVSGKGYEALVRDLYDTMERETDLREQMRFAEDEIKTMRRKLSSLESENETVVMQLKKMATSRSKSGGSRPADDELSPEELKLQFELCEQEMCVLRKKVDELEHEREGLNKEVKYLQDKLINQPLASIELPELPPLEKTGANVYYEQKMKLLEFEARELRRKVVEKERDNERLQTEVEVHRRKASKVIVRSRSLDSEFQVDLKRQLHLVEQEASILRTKTIDLENENDKLSGENKRFQLRLSRKPPPGPAELMQLENLEFKEKMQEMNRKMGTLKEELQKVAGGQMASATVIQEYKPKREASSDTENQLVLTLKKTIKTKDEEVVTLQTKVTQLELETTRINREYKKLKDTLSYKKRPNRPVRETATRMELKDIIKDLEDEISDLQVTVRGREMVQEDLREEIARTKTQFETAAKESKQREDKMTTELTNLRTQTDKLRTESNSERLKSSSLAQQVKRFAEDTGTDMTVVDKMQTLQNEKEKLEAKIKELTAELVKEQNKSQEIQDKLKLITSLRDELAQGNKILESQKKDADKETKKYKDLLNKAEGQVKTLRKKAEDNERETTDARKELDDFKNKMVDERSKIKQHDSRQTEVAVGWLKERDELKKLLSDLRSKAESLQDQMDTQEEQWTNKETKIKDEYTKKTEKAVKEAKQSLEADIKNAQKEEKSLKNKCNELADKLEKSESSLKDSQDKVRANNNQHRKDKDEWQIVENDLESKLRSEIKKNQRLEKDHDQEKKQKEQEILALKDKMFHLERESRKTQSKMDDLEHEHAERIKEMERQLEQERSEYDDLTTKYELLEEDYLNRKTRLVAEKENMQTMLNSTKKDHETINTELKALKKTFTSKQDGWNKEKIEMNETIKTLHSKLEKLTTLEQEKLQLKDTINEKESLIDSYKKEEKHLKEERERLRRRVDELGKKVAELERSERASRTVVMAGRQEAAKEAQDLRVRYDHSETTHKGELATMKVEYEGKLRLLSQEMQIMQTQIGDIVQEREILISKLEESEEMVEQIKTSTLKRDRMRKNDEIEANRRKTEDLQRQFSMTLEKLENSQLECKSLRVQLETEKNSWQGEIVDLKSKMNQMEERNLMETSRGATRGLTKTRLELAWDKERQDQQKQLQETQNLVSDLRDKILTLETLRDKEKQEARRQILDLKDLMDLEEQTSKRKMGEIQGDQYEVKETINKLRSQVEAMRREKERYEQERDQWRVRLINSEDVQIRVSDLMEEVQKMASLVAPPPPPPATDAVKTANGTVPVPSTAQAPLAPGEKPKPKPRRGSKANEELRIALEKIKKRTEELQRASTSMNDAESPVNSPAFRRAISATDLNTTRIRGSSGDPSHRWMNPQRNTNYPLAPPSMILRPPPRQKAMFRKSLSLDQHLQSDLSGKIWDSGDESLNNTPYGSQLSLRSRIRDNYYNTHGGYESDGSVGGRSLDSRANTLPKGLIGLSIAARPLQSRTGSRESSVVSSADESTYSLPAKMKTKKTLREKLKLSSKKKPPSVEESVAQAGLASATLGLGSQPLKADKEEKSIRSRISKALKKPLSRGSSVDRSGNEKERPGTEKDDLAAVKAALQKGEDLMPSSKHEKSKKGLIGRLTSSSSASKTQLSPEEPEPPPLRVDNTPTAGASMRSAGVIRQRSTDTRY